MTWQAVLDRQQGLATRRQLLEAGLTRHGLDRRAATGRLVRVRPAVYARPPVPARGAHLVSGGRPDPGFVAEVRAALLAHGPGARAGGRTAAVLWGLDLAVEPTVLELLVPHGRRLRPGPDDVRQSRSGRTALLVPVPGCAAVAASTAVDTVLACAGELPLAEGVVLVDSALRTGACTRSGLRRALSARRGTADLARIRAALRWCDPRSGSVLESLLRVLLCQAGLQPPSTQHPVLDGGGRQVARVDLAWPAARLVVEVDGRRWHDPADRRDADRRRDNRCAALGWRVLRFTWADVVHRPEAVVGCVRAALACSPAPLSSTS